MWLIVLAERFVRVREEGSKVVAKHHNSKELPEAYRVLEEFDRLYFKFARIIISYER